MDLTYILLLQIKMKKNVGRHLLDGSIIYTTEEIIITELVDLEFKRELEPIWL